jgi:predicted nucleic acid-binding protein
MKILVDTNVILDVLCNRPEFIEASSKVWKYCEVDQIEGYISALSVPNIVYILRKELTPQKTEQLIQQITMIFKVVDLKSTDLKAAAKMLSSDYEDALQAVTAERLRVDFIITRNVKDFKQSKVLALTPAELLARL